MTGNIQQGFNDPSVNVTLQGFVKEAAATGQELSAERLTAQIDLQASLAEMTNPSAARLIKSGKELKTHQARVRAMLKAGEKEQRMIPLENIKDSASQFQQRNPELKAQTLLLLRERIKPGDTKDDILKKLKEFYPDVSLADEALEFLLETTEGELALAVQAAKNELNDPDKGYSREIIAGRNIAAQAREAATQGLGTPTTLRDMYRDITGNPRDAATLYKELSNQYKYKEMKKVIDFLLHSLGADMKSKGPSIPHGQLHQLFTEVRSLQAIRGVYNYFKGRMALVEKLLKKEDLEPEFNFESLTRCFMDIAAERYPTADKILQQGNKLGCKSVKGG